jgi:phosphoglycerol transferase MdoB-like AlkP superfamily enzyme
MFKNSWVRGNIIVVIFLRLLIALFVFWLSRFAFYFFNNQYFADISFFELLRICWHGLRFDLSAIVILNIGWIFLLSVPFKFRERPLYLKIVNVLFFYVPNIIGLAANFIDTVYFRFTLKRTTGDIFEYVANEEGGFLNLLPQFIGKFYLEFLCWILFVVIFIFLASKINIKKTEHYKTSLSYFIRYFLFFVFISGASIIGIRGGFQLKPTNLSTAANYTASKNIPLILNTPFSLIKTIGLKGLPEKAYFSETELEGIYNPVHKAHKNDSAFNKKNVVIIIMESFSTEHIKSLNPYFEQEGLPGYTPFLDSLISKSIVFKGFANGKRSIEGIPAIVAGLPTLMNRDYLSSIYAGNKIDALPRILKSKGYQSAFFHGGNNGTMSFDTFANLAGFEQYFGRNEFDDESGFDGKWGIFDEPFFQYFGEQINTFRQPFFTTLFSLSSHHPYTIPEKYLGKFQKGPLAIHESISYADFALKQFFETAAKMPWFKNTIFVITADHTSESYLPKFSTIVGNYQIPIVFYSPNGDTNFISKTVAQQIDIMPTLLSLLNFDKDYFAFGTDLFDDSQRHFAINYTGTSYQLIENNHNLIFDGQKTQALYNFKKDKLLKNNIMSAKPSLADSMATFCKAIVQQYNHRMIENQLSLEE